MSEQANNVKQAVCVTVSVYGNALTRGKQYSVIGTNSERDQFRVEGDNGRSRWFPGYCFATSDTPVPTLIGIQFDSSIESYDLPVEVVVELSNEQKRWCIVATPDALAKCGDIVEGTNTRLHFGNRHVIVATEISEDRIRQILEHIDHQGMLEECTLSLDDGRSRT